MKLNNLSRLMALLMAMMMLSTVGASAATSFDLGEVTYDTLQQADAAAKMIADNKCSLCTETLTNLGLLTWPIDGYDCLHTHLASMTPNEVYQMLYDLDKGTSAEYTLSQAYINAHNSHVDATDDKYLAAVICYGFDCYKNPPTAPGPSHVHVLLDDGSVDTANTCPWYQETQYVPTTTLTDTATGISVTGVIPDDVALVVTDSTITDTSFVETEIFYSTPTITGYNITLYHTTTAEDGTVTMGDKWQPVDDGVTVDVTIPGIWTVGSVFPVVDIYHITTTDTAGMVTSYAFMTNMNDTVTLNSDGSVTFSASSFSDYVVADGELNITINLSNSVGGGGGNGGRPGQGSGGTSSSSSDTDTVYHVYVQEKTSADIIFSFKNSSGSIARGIIGDVEDIITSSYSGSKLTINVTAAATATNTYTYTMVYTRTSNSITYTCTYTFYVHIVTAEVYAELESTNVSDNTYATSANNFGSNVAGFYWRFESETGSHTYDPVEPQNIIKTITYTSESGKNTGTVPHYLFSDSAKNSGLLCRTVLDNVTAYSGTTPTAYDVSQGFTLYIETEPGWVVTSYCIRCEFGTQAIDSCQTVSNNAGLVYAPSTDNTYVSKITRVYNDASPFGHGSNNGGSSVTYALVLTVAQVNINIDVEKAAEPVTIVAGNDVEYTVTATNKTTGITFDEIRIQDSFFALDNVTITSVQYKDISEGTTENVTYSHSTGSDTITIKSTWAPSDQVIITYTYTTKESDPAATLDNTVVVYGDRADATATDMGVAFVEVIVNEATTGTMRVTKTFSGLLTEEVEKVLETYTATVTRDSSTEATGEGLTFATISPGDWTFASSNSETKTFVYYANVSGLEPGTYTITESGYNVEGYRVTSSGMAYVYHPADDTDEETTQIPESYTSGTTIEASVEAGHTTFAFFENVYSNAQKAVKLVKKWVDANGEAITDTSAYPEVTFTLKAGDVKIGEYTLIGKDKWEQYVILDAEYADSTLTVEEAAVEGYRVISNVVGEIVLGGYSVEVEVKDDEGNITTETKKYDLCEITVTNGPSHGALTITKAGSDVADTDSFIFTVKGTDDATDDIDMQVVITGTNSVTIDDLPLGTYTVTEDLEWAWRYELDSVTGDATSSDVANGTATVSVDADGTNLTFNNSRPNDQWLSDESSIVNFAGTNQ